jgi:hypothetical protein
MRACGLAAFPPDSCRPAFGEIVSLEASHQRDTLQLMKTMPLKTADHQDVAWHNFLGNTAQSLYPPVRQPVKVACVSSPPGA